MCLISILSILPIFDVVSAKRFLLFIFERVRISRPVSPNFFFYSFFKFLVDSNKMIDLGDSPCSRKRLLSFNDQPPAVNSAATPVMSPHRPPRRVDNNHGGSTTTRAVGGGGPPPGNSSSSSNNNSTATAAVAALAATTSSTSAFHHSPVKPKISYFYFFHPQPDFFIDSTEVIGVLLLHIYLY
jgi:hypothetical protein